MDFTAQGEIPGEPPSGCSRRKGDIGPGIDACLPRPQRFPQPIDAEVDGGGLGAKGG
jgi:hypothetical protein